MCRLEILWLSHTDPQTYVSFEWAGNFTPLVKGETRGRLDRSVTTLFNFKEKFRKKDNPGILGLLVLLQLVCR